MVFFADSLDYFSKFSLTGRSGENERDYLPAGGGDVHEISSQQLSQKVWTFHGKNLASPAYARCDRQSPDQEQE